MQRPYLTPELDERYQLKASREGCLNWWGAPIYQGTYIGEPITFKQHGFYPTGQAEGGQAIEMRYTLPTNCKPLMDDINKGFVNEWLGRLSPPRTDLLAKSHPYVEAWKIRGTTLSMIVVWLWAEPDWTVVPDCVPRLLQVAEVIKSIQK